MVSFSMRVFFSEVIACAILTRRKKHPNGRTRAPGPGRISAGDSMDILDAIGNTSLVRLRKVVPPGCADIFVKLEWENPTGSLKDRMARAVIFRAEADGRLKPGDTVVEYTGGSTGA